MINELLAGDPLERRSSLAYLSDTAIQRLTAGPCPDLSLQPGELLEKSSFLGYTYAFTRKELLSKPQTLSKIAQLAAANTIGRWMARLQGLDQSRIRAIDIIVQEDIGKIGNI